MTCRARSGRVQTESYCPKAVQQAPGSVFNSIYAEGHPRLRMTRDEIGLLQQVDHELCYYRRYAGGRVLPGRRIRGLY